MGGVPIPSHLSILELFLLIYTELKSVRIGGWRPKRSTRHNSCLAG